MGSSEEEDYMSDAFLMGAEKVTPGLQFSKVAARKRVVEQRAEKANTSSKAEHKLHSKKLKEEFHRNEKLQTALDESNKGFALLSKMGFKKGMGLGKDGSGISEPIPLEIKEGRGGLGREADLKRKSEIKKELYEQKSKYKKQMVERMTGEFKERLKDKFSDRLTQGDLKKSQCACEDLDNRKGLDCLVPWYWREIPNEDDSSQSATEDQSEPTGEENDEDEEELDDYEKLTALTHYLRTTHYYCIWCGTSYNDELDMDENCPGDSREDHDS